MLWNAWHADSLSHLLLSMGFFGRSEVTQQGEAVKGRPSRLKLHCRWKAHQSLLSVSFGESPGANVKANDDSGEGGDKAPAHRLLIAALDFVRSVQHVCALAHVALRVLCAHKGGIVMGRVSVRG